MAKEEKKSLSSYKTREALSYETWLSAPVNFMITKNEEVHPVPTISISGDCSKVDAVLVIGDNLRAAAEAARFMEKQKKAFGEYPNVVCSNGFTTSKKINYGYSEAFWLKLVLVRMGIPKKVADRFTPEFKTQPIYDLLHYFRDGEKIAVFSSRGYSLPVAQELFEKMPDVDWRFYENPVIAEEDRIFESEIIGEEGFAVDFMLANIVHCCRGQGMRRYPLSDESWKSMPKVKVMQKFLRKGYAFALEGWQDWEFFDIELREGLELASNRRNDFRWLYANSRMHVRHQVELLVKQYQDPNFGI